jgi:alpha-L-rhamnosidase
VSGLSRAPQDGDAVGVVVHTDVPVTATFESSDPLLNRIFQMGVQTHLYNMHSILEDCPHREKCMWGGDLHASWSVGFHTLDSTAFYRQAVDLYYTPPFAKEGIPGNVGVGRRLAAYFSDFTWAVSPLFLAYRLYQVDGELETARRHYAQMQAFLRYFEKHAPGLIPQEAAHGDHAAPPDIKRNPQDKRLIAAMNFFAACNRFSELAEALDKPDDAAWAAALAGRIRTAILEKYYDAENHTFGNGTHDSLALAFGLPETKERSLVARSLAKVYRENGKKFDGGFMSYFIYPELTENGQVDLALEMLRNADYPGLAQSIVRHDATTIWERYFDDQQSFENQSHNHHAMNHSSGWLVTHIAGIQASHQKILLSPHVPADLDWVNAAVGTLRGTVTSTWTKQEGKVKWTVIIPSNCTAEVRFPSGSDLSELILTSGRYYFEWPQKAQCDSSNISGS